MCLGAVIAVASCSGSSDALLIVANSRGSVGTGEQRILLSIIDQSTNELMASPDLEVVATLRDGIGSPIGEFEGQFLWLIPDVRGMYSFTMDIPGPATYQLTLDAGELGELGPVGLEAVTDPPQIAVGDMAPRSATRTLEDAALDDLTSDPDPDESLYELTVAEAVDAGPAVIVLATPAWCTTQSCGPMVDQVQAIKGGFDEVNFVHVEVFENIHVTNREDLVLAPGISDWGITSEPWLYVVDGDGIVTSAFEGAVSDEELVEAIAAVAP